MLSVLCIVFVCFFFFLFCFFFVQIDTSADEGEGWYAVKPV